MGCGYSKQAQATIARRREQSANASSTSSATATSSSTPAGEVKPSWGGYGLQSVRVGGKVVKVCRGVVNSISVALNDTDCRNVMLTGQYEGERNAAGQREGRGTYRFAAGDVYEGDWKADEREGRGRMSYANGGVYEGDYTANMKQGLGTYLYASGDVYEGERVAGRREGCGTYRYAGGRAEVSWYRAGEPVGEGAQWSDDRQTACRLHDGKVHESIPLEEAARIADEIGLPVPSVSGAPLRIPQSPVPPRKSTRVRFQQ